MYNLIVSGSPEAFDGQTFAIEAARCMSVSEYTASEIAAQFQPLRQGQLDQAATFPTIFAYEKGVKRPARIGQITRARNRHGEVRIEFSFSAAIPPIPPDALETAAWELDIGKNELYRTHWAIKAPDLGEALIEAKLATLQQAYSLTLATFPSDSARSETGLISPTAFEIPTRPREPDLVAVMMPFKAEFSPVWESIKRAGLAAQLRCLRASDIWQESVLVQDIFSLIWTSSIVVVDFTERNANVMYETGIAHTLGRPVVPISQSDRDVPFDLHHHRYLRYSTDSPGLAEMEMILAERLRTVSRRVAQRSE